MGSVELTYGQIQYVCVIVYGTCTLVPSSAIWSISIAPFIRVDNWSESEREVDPFLLFLVISLILHLLGEIPVLFLISTCLCR